MKKGFFALAFLLMADAAIGTATVAAAEKLQIEAIYIPLADHYAGIVAYEKYRHHMKKADYRIKRAKSWPLLRAYFMSGRADMAYIMCPMAMDMFAKEPRFRWVSLLHRDGNALAINDFLNAEVKLPKDRQHRRPDEKVAEAYVKVKKRMGRPSECGVPHLLATHTVVLYKYLTDHGKGLDLGSETDKDVLAIEVPPAESPSFIRERNSSGIPASFEQSLPWADVVETGGFGHVAWYSKDVMPWPNGHVDCIAIATDDCIKHKREALKEVVYYIHKAGLDIEDARQQGGQAMITISDMIRKHIPEHNQRAIIQSLRPDLDVINYRNLNVDKPGLKQIMDLAVEGGILKKPIDIDVFTDNSFSTQITEQEIISFPTDYSGYADRITNKTKKAVKTHLRDIKGWASTLLLVNAVKEQNASGPTLDEIKTIDREWIAGERSQLVSILQNNPTGVFLREKVLSDTNIYTEAFLCDNTGAIVGEYPETSDYWQGDEEIFTECFKSGNGRVFIAPLVYDESTRSFSIKLSVPVKEQSKTIGVLIVGIRNIK